MKRARLWIAVIALAAVSLEPLTARSDTPPGTWDIARDPAERGRWALPCATASRQPIFSRRMAASSSTRTVKAWRLPSARACAAR